MLAKKEAVDSQSKDKSSGAYVDQYNDMLRETTQRASALRKFDNENNLMGTNEQILNNSVKNYANDLGQSKSDLGQSNSE